MDIGNQSRSIGYNPRWIKVTNTRSSGYNPRWKQVSSDSVDPNMFLHSRSQVYSVGGEQRQVLNTEYTREREQLIQPLIDLKLYDQVPETFS